jgi:soluble lytic murein transglycosylase-like protein
MQVNLFWHRNKVSNDLALLDPITNINVAAQYLRDINKKNINKTVSDYHAPTNPVLGNKYVNHVKKYEKIIHEKIK